MPHTPETRARAYEKMKRLRAEWFAANGPCKQCASEENLELDHKNPEEKVSHSVWSWEPRRRELELKKCQVLCRNCHRVKTAANRMVGRVVPKLRKLSDKQVLKAVLWRRAGMRTRQIAAKMGVCHVTIVRLTNAAIKGKDFHHRGSLLGS
jgi:5-methylcytosine-specific restriction endonuclease McrA